MSFFPLRLRKPVLLCAQISVASICFSQSFTNVSSSLDAEVICSSQLTIGGGCAWFDYNNDGNEDLYITGGVHSDALFHNNQDGTFTNVIFEAGFIETSDKTTLAVVTGDIDNDGFREVFISTQNVGLGANHVENFLFYNNGDGTFSDITDTAGLIETKWAESATFLDSNSDGLLDLYVSNYIENAEITFDEFNNPDGFAHECYPDDLYINQGDLTFINATNESGIANDGCTLAAIATDFNRDGKIDVFAVNDFGEWVEPNRLFKNEGNSFTEVGQISGCDQGIYGMGIASADYDEDMDLDYYVTNIGANLLLCQENEFFENAAEEAGVDNEIIGAGFGVGWGTFFFDYDNDTYLDLFVANGYINAAPWIDSQEAQNDVLFQGTPSAIFTDASNELPSNPFRSRGCAYADYDNDGDLDMGVLSVQFNLETADDHFVLYQNEGNTNNYVSFDLEGLVCNRDAYGSQLELYADGRSFLREVTAGSSHCSQNSSIVHFGLGQIGSIDSVIVNWPIGPAQVFDTLGINQIHEILQDTTVVVGPPDTVITSIEFLASPLYMDVFPVPASGHINLKVRGYSGKVQIQLFDLNGREVWAIFEGDIGIMPKQFLVPGDLRKGLYLCSVKTDDGRKFAVKKVEIISD